MAPDDRAPPNRSDDQKAASSGCAGVGDVTTFAVGAERLLDNGYEPLPLLRGKKYPIVKQWSSLPIDPPQVAAWVHQFPLHGIGLRCGVLVGFDIDIMAPDLAHEVTVIVEARLGATMMRVGLWPKRLLLYRTETAFAKIKVSGIEVLCSGQQFAAFGIHPDTRRPYAWPLGESPLDTPLDQLPIVTREQCFALVAELEQLIPSPAGASERGKRRTGPSAPVAPQRDLDGRVVEGRGSWLSSIAFHAVHDMLDAGEFYDADVLTTRVWGRFVETTDLARKKGDGDRAYERADAATKVRDKLRLAGENRLPSRRRDAVQVIDPPPTSPIDQAREQLCALVGADCTHIGRWLAGEIAGEPPQLGIKATVGLGKSAVARSAILAMRQSLQAQGLPSRIIVLTPSHALADETAAAWRAEGAHAAVWRGYEAKRSTTQQPMCVDLDAVRLAILAGVDVQTSACTSSNGRFCRHFATCAKQANRREVMEADIIVAPYDALFTGFAVQADSVAMILIDEGCWARAVETTSDLWVETIAEDLLDRDAASAPSAKAFGEAADLQDLRRRLRSALAANGQGPLSRRRLYDNCIRADDAAAAIAIERRRLRNPHLYPGMSREELKRAGRVAATNHRTRSYLALWRAAQTLLFGETDVDGRIEIGAPDAKTGLSPVTVLRVKSVHQNLRELPLLHLDATLRPELARAVLPALAIKEVAAEAPHMQVTLVAGSFGKGSIVTDSFANAAENQRRSNNLVDCLDYVRWHSRRYRRTLVICYKAIEAAFADIPGVETGHFNAIAGLDVFREVDLLVIIGRPLPRESDLHRLSAALFGHVPAGGYEPAMWGVRMRDGTSRRIRTIAHVDQLAEQIRAAICDDELMQAIGRGRGVNRTAATPLEVRILADVALPLVHDRMLSWNTEAPDIVQRMLLAGIAVDSPTDAVLLHPDLLGNETQAQKAFERAGFRRQNPISNIYREMSAKCASYRKPGKGRSWQRAYWLRGSSDIARRELEAALGPLAKWRADDE